MGWYSLDLTKSERAVLDAIWSDRNKVATYRMLSDAARLTPRGLRTVLNRMSDRSLLAPVLNNGGLTITFKGMQALGMSAR